MPRLNIGDKFGQVKVWHKDRRVMADLFVIGWTLNTDKKTIEYTLEMHVTEPDTDD